MDCFDALSERVALGQICTALSPGRRPDHLFVPGISPETQSGHLKHAFRGHLPRIYVGEGGLELRFEGYRSLLIDVGKYL